MFNTMTFLVINMLFRSYRETDVNSPKSTDDSKVRSEEFAQCPFLFLRHFV